MSKGVQRPSSVHLFFWTMKQCVGGQWRDFVAVLVKVRSWAINHQLTESQRPPLSLPLTLLLSLGGRRGSTVQGQGGWGGILFLYDCETVCSGSNEYFWWALPPCFFVFLTSITTSVAMHACFLRERKGVESFFSFLCMNSNRSAGGGRRGGAWRVYTAGGVRKRENLGWCVMRGDSSDGCSRFRPCTVSGLWGRVGGGQSSPLQSTWVIYALCCVVLMVITCLSPLWVFFFLD